MKSTDQGYHCTLNLEYKIKKSITENPLFINPIEIVLGEREENAYADGSLY